MTRRIYYNIPAHCFAEPHESIQALLNKAATQVVPNVTDQLIGGISDMEKMLAEEALNERGLEIGDEVPGTQNIFEIKVLKCMRNYCHRDATKRAVLTFKASPSMPETSRASAITGIFICDEHAFTDPDEFITHPGWEQIRQSFIANHLVPPDRRTIKVHFTPIERNRA